MRPRLETMDEAIDRVAASLTAVRDDEEFVARLEARLDVRSFRAHARWLVAVPATAAVILALVISFDQNPPQRIPIDTSAGLAPDAPSVPARDVIAPRVAAEQRAVRVESELAHAAPDTIRHIAALNEPPTLNVDALVVESLTIDPVTEPGLLELPSLEVRDIDAVADQKEQ
jgi:hypothetical protein